MAGEKAKVLNCVQCGGAVQWRAPGFSITLVCGHCGAVLDVSNPEIQVLIQAQEKTRLKPLIPLGTRGKFHGETYEVIGFMQRADGTGQYKWREYLLFNPYIGYRWLVEADGHWNYVISTKQKPHRRDKSAQYLNKSYQLFLTGEAQVFYVLGEFYWRVKKGDRVSVQDFINPPEMLSREWDAGEEVWSIGEYVEPEVVQAAFGIKAMPARIGVSPNQPSPHDAKYRRIFWAAAVMTLLLLLIQLGTNRSGRQDPVYVEVASAAGLKAAGGKLPKLAHVRAGGLDFLLRTTVSGYAGPYLNLDVQMNTPTGIDTFRVFQEFRNAAERATAVSAIADLPDGDYQVTVQPFSGPWPMSGEFRIELIPQRSQWSNFVGAGLLLWFYPLWLKFRRWSFNTTRWMQSDFAEE